MNRKTILNKLTSRKFWAMLSGLAVSILAMVNSPEEVNVQIASLITSLGAVVAYIFGEAVIDREKTGKEQSDE